MNWYRNPYFGKTVERRRDSVVQRLESGDVLLPFFLITLPPTSANQLEILSLRMYRLQKELYGEPLIIGVALGQKEARQLAVQITGDVYRLTGTAEVRSFFEQRAEAAALR